MRERYTTRKDLDGKWYVFDMEIRNYVSRGFETEDQAAEERAFLERNNS